jgi:prophage maintenance system killer protein
MKLPSYADIVGFHNIVESRPPGVLESGFRTLAKHRVDGRAVLANIIVRMGQALTFEGALAEMVVGIAFDQPFADGNKRTTFLAFGATLDWNNRFFIVDDEQITRLIRSCQQSFAGPVAVQAWIRLNTMSS